MGPKVLIVSTDVAWRAALASLLLDGEIDSDGVSTPAEAFDQIAAAPPDGVLLTWFPDAPKLCRGLRMRLGHTTPILVTQAPKEATTGMLKVGADGCTDPQAGLAEVLARLRTLLRPAWPELFGEPLALSDVRLDRLRQRAWRGETPLSLGAGEFRALSFLMRHPRRMFAPEALATALSRPGARLTPGALEKVVMRLRRALMAAGGPDPIRTVRQVGYALDPPDAP